MEQHKILIVDDDPDVLLSLSDLLNDEGFEAKPVNSGEEALDVFLVFNPSVVITDMNMSGMSGLELLQALRKLNPYVQIIIITGYASIKNVAEAMSNNGAFAYFQKPVTDFEIFFSTIRQAFEKERLIRENYHWEERLKMANARFETIFENMDAVIYVADINTYDLLYANSKFKTLFGNYKEQNSNGKRKKCWELLQKINNGPCPFCTNSKIVDANGKPLNPYTWEFYNPVVKKWFSIKDQAIYWHDGRVVRLETAMDITQYHKMSREVEKSKRFQAVGVLAGGIAHDLNNTLATILGNINLAQLISSDPASEDYFVAAESGIMQAKTLSGKLLALAKGDAPVKTVVDMRDILNSFIRENQFSSEVVFTIRDESKDSNSSASDFNLAKKSDFNINADADQIKTAIYNIVINASESMNLKGKINVELKRYYSGMRNCDYVMTSIQDTGKGIASSNLDKVFDPYFSTKFQGKERGTGLGLSIAYSIIKKHGGYIDIDSVEGKGTQVDVCLPAVF
ncbi:MAG: response regulator [Desulfamplus sp.]|nr:response regulator [Desulfamplus sp.]